MRNGSVSPGPVWLGSGDGYSLPDDGQVMPMGEERVEKIIGQGPSSVAFSPGRRFTE